MPENSKKVFYALTNPLSCLLYARELVRSVNGSNIHVILPKHIEPSKFEYLLLKDAEYFNGITVQGISTFPRMILASKGYFNLPKRVDQIALLEHFHKSLPKGLARPLLNAVLELKHADFEHDYLNDLLEKRKDKEGAILLDVFKEYNSFLRKTDVFDDADTKAFFVNEVLNPASNIISENEVFIFAGFHELSSYDLDIIKTVSKKAAKTFVVSPNILDTELEYSKLLSESFTSMGFSMVRINDDRKTKVTVHEFNNINEEAFYVSNAIKDGTVYAVSNVDSYYSLFRYHQGVDAVSINAAMRLDRSSYLTMISTVLLLNERSWMYSDVIKLLHFTPFWKDQEAVLKLVDVAHERLTLPRSFTAWKLLAEEQNNTEVKDFFNYIHEKIPAKALPLNFERTLKKFFNNEGDLECDSILNLVSRVVECLEPQEITSATFVRKLYHHAEENYVAKGPYVFKPLNVTLASLAAGNISENVWFVGMNQDAFSGIAKEDVVMNDELVLAFRHEGFLLATSRESSAIASKIIRDASANSSVSSLKNIGAVADLFKGVEPIKHEKQNWNVLNGAVSELKPKEIELKEHKFPRLSASLIKAYLECPYVCMAQRILKTEKEDLRDLSLNPKDAGNLLHKALELLLPQALKNIELNIEAELNKILEQDFVELLRHPLKNVFIKYYSSVVENILREEVVFMKEHKLEIFDRTESEFKVVLDIDEGVSVKGKIDRIDVDKANKKLYVADYKTSQIPTGTSIKSGEDIQLAVYIMAMAQKQPDFDYDGYYISIKDLKHSPAGLLSLDKAKEYFSIHGLNAIKGIKNGVFSPAPMDMNTCEKCNYRRCCGTV